MVVVKGRVLVEGRGRGPLLRLSHPISFWGGVDVRTGAIADPRHPEHGRSIAGTVLAVPEAIGSSSSSAIMLELVREGTAPAAVILGRADAILALGAVVARELGYEPPPILEMGMEELARVRAGSTVEVIGGEVRIGPEQEVSPR